jgi:hypothetical protein
MSPTNGEDSLALGDGKTGEFHNLAKFKCMRSSTMSLAYDIWCS